MFYLIQKDGCVHITKRSAVNTELEIKSYLAPCICSNLPTFRTF
uniref:Uncharacterized protein n=1 Tax=Anguilla anguilla TaxID=7936 RepID=A0A0E9W4C7_ANGAN